MEPSSRRAADLRPNPANLPGLINDPLEPYRYDHADGCRSQVEDGMRAFKNWLGRNVRGESWGIYRCERLGDGWSVHSESRAIDWRLDAGIDAEKRAAMRLIDVLLDRDRRERRAALARRMGVQGIIFNCHAWWSGMRRLGDYSYCFRDNGERRTNLDRTAAHKDHVHLELNWPGARGKTSFWDR